MKKILSVLLAMTLLIGCCSVALTSFAANNLAQTSYEGLVTLINSQTKFAAVQIEDNGVVTHHSSGYSFIRSVNSTGSVSGDANGVLSSMIKDNFSEYADCVAEGSTDLDYGLLAKRIAGIDSVNNTINETVSPVVVPKSVNGSDVLGKNALKATTLSTDDITSITVNGSTYTISLKNIDVSNGDKIEDSALADLLGENIASDIGDKIVSALVAKNTGIDFTNFKFTISGIQVIALFNGLDNANIPTSGTLTSLIIKYNVSYSSDIYYASVHPFKLSGTINVTNTYNSFIAFNEATDIDASKFAATLNDVTNNAVSNKAGYNYNRSADFVPGDSSFTLEFTGTILPTIVGGIGSVVDVQAKVKDIVSSSLNFGNQKVTIKPRTNASDYLANENFGLSVTSAEAKDFSNLYYDANLNGFVFTLSNVTNPTREGSALSHVTSDFVSGEELRNSFGLSFMSNGVSLLKDTDTCDVAYSNIEGYAKFNGATAENPYGDGTLNTYGVSYNYDANVSISAISATMAGSAAMRSASSNIVVPEYVMGDTDMSGTASIIDARLMLNVIAENTTVNAKQVELSDYNGNGIIDITDVRALLSQIAAE